MNKDVYINEAEQLINNVNDSIAHFMHTSNEIVMKSALKVRIYMDADSLTSLRAGLSGMLSMHVYEFYNESTIMGYPVYPVLTASKYLHISIENELK